MKRRSLRTRLIVAFCILITLAWVISTSISYVKTRHRIRHIFDAQQLVFAQRLEDSDLEQLIAQPSSSRLLNIKQDKFRKANDALSFAIFSLDGQMLLTDMPEDSKLLFDSTLTITNEPMFTNSDKWRILWHKTPDDKFIIAVAQENAYRNKMTGEIIIDHQVTPWFVIMPALMAAIIYMINRELKPIKQVTRALTHRKPGDSTPIKNDRLPSEIQPLIDELNSLFERISSTIERERRFVSDAAHELRSPLAALQVQTEVAQISTDKPKIQREALQHLTAGIMRATRLTEQLLALSKLDSFSELPNKEPIDWQTIINQLLADFAEQAEKQRITIATEYCNAPTSCVGDPLLLSLMMRNLIDNALRYTPKNEQITINLTEQDITVFDNGPGVAETDLAKIGQRFYRPPGQKQTGSGLGLSITRQIAELHGFKFSFGNRNEGGFYCRIRFSVVD